MEEKKQLIISIGREFGSGGHEIAENLAERFGITFYDYHLIGDIAAGRKIDVEVLERFDELPKTPFFSRTVRGYSNSLQENLARMQFDFLKKQANEGKSFVIVGRCAEEILKENPNMVTIFISADLEVKMRNVAKKEGLSLMEAEEMIAQHDRKRKTYHNHFCRGKWGDSRNYEVCLNGSKLGIQGTVDILEQYIRMRFGL